jgi:hypothetical protein
MSVTFGYGSLPPGSDGSPGSGTPSFLLTFGVGSTQGTFEIDTCCASPFNHIAMTEAGTFVAYFPNFTKGVVTVTAPLPNQPPVALCRNVTVSASGSCQGFATGADADNGSYDPDGDEIFMWLEPTDPYPLGTTDVDFIVYDGEDSDTCDAQVTVEDNTPPTAICPANMTVDTDPGQCNAVVHFTIGVDDNCPGGTVSSQPSSGYAFPRGTSLVTVIARDAVGDADTCYFDVIVEDNELPTAICPDDTIVVVGQGETGKNVTFSIDATDNCSVSSVTADPPSGSFFPLGVTQVTVTARDGDLNEGTCHFNVTVNPPPPPNSLVIESKTVSAGETGVTVGGYVTNDLTLLGIAMPLEFRSITPGSFITNSLTLTVQGRVGASGLMDIEMEEHYADPDASNSCSGPVSRSYSIPAPLDFFTPDALVWTGVRIGGPVLAPGTDGEPGLGTPSFLFTFDVTSNLGSFEIDTCCKAPDAHLQFVEDPGMAFLPDFTKGVVTIVDPGVCNERPMDVNCDNVVDVIDVVALVNVAFRNYTEPGECCYQGP